ncbi:MAG: hypothetical protein IKI71_00455 [Lachnospiraceae bacterium]|nr:hypothetical protein [Lachnospiraceae bacterium]
MIKKIIIIWLSILLLVIVGLIVLTSNKDKDNVLTGNISDSTIDNRFYDKIGSSINYDFLFDYLCYNSNYNSIPVTENYKVKYKNCLSELYDFEKYNTEMYNYEETAPNQLLTFVDCDYKSSFIVKLLILKSVYDDHPKLNKKLFFNYTVDDRGFVDDIEFIGEEVYREDDGTPIIRPNNRKFDVPENVAGYIENLVYGMDLIKYKRKNGWGDYYDNSIDEIEWEFKEYALTDNFKKHYNINKGLLIDELKQQAYKNEKNITMYYPKEISMYYSKFPKEKTSMLPIRLYYDGIYYNYNLSYSITDDYFLDELKLDEIQ